jgi:hypothetical protein
LGNAFVLGKTKHVIVLKHSRPGALGARLVDSSPAVGFVGRSPNTQEEKGREEKYLALPWYTTIKLHPVCEVFGSSSLTVSLS